MIVRKSNINPKAREVRLPMAFGSPDAKSWLKDILQAFADGGMVEDVACRLPFDEVSLRLSLERSKFNIISEDKWSQQLSAWAWSQWVALGYLTESGTKEGTYYPSRKALALVKWKEPTHDNDD